MQDFKAYPDRIYDAADTLRQMQKRVELFNDEMHGVLKNMQPILKEDPDIGTVMNRVLGKVYETGKYIGKQTSALREVADIYDAAERQCRDNNALITVKPAAKPTVLPPTDHGYTEHAMSPSGLLVDDWLAELINNNGGRSNG